MLPRSSFKSSSASKVSVRIAHAALLASMCIATVIDDAAAEPYPSKPIKVISPFSAGGPPDVLGRLIGQKLSERFAVPSQSITARAPAPRWLRAPQQRPIQTAIRCSRSTRPLPTRLCCIPSPGMIR